LISTREHRRANAPQAYKRAHGDCNVPQRWATDQQLAKWVSEQRTYKKALDRGEPAPIITAARVAKLDGLGFAWEMTAAAIRKQRSEVTRNDAGWEAQLAKLKAYKRKHGDCIVPQRWAEDPSLGTWVKDQRAGKKKLDRGEPSEGMTAARVAKLEALGFAWEMSVVAVSKQRSEGSRDDAGWEAQLAKLKAYKRKHGDCCVPQRWAEDLSLGRWASNQRHYKKKLDRGEPSEGMTAARAAKLEALGFAWEAPAAAIGKGSRDEAGWAAQLAKLKAYKRKHGDCNVPKNLQWANLDEAGGAILRCQSLPSTGISD
jgi:hypothetical protein